MSNKEVVCPDCDANDWDENVSYLSDPPKMRCNSCKGYFTRAQMVEKDYEAPPPPSITAELLMADAELPSGHIYPRAILEAAVKELKPHMTMGKVLGEFDPEDAGPEVKLGDAATVIKTMYFKDDILMADMEIMNTLPGERLKAFLRDGGSIKIVPRGVGEVEENEEGDHMVSEYTMITVDIYSIPPE